MGVTAKNRRRIQYKGQNFVWWVAPNDDDCDRIYLNIVSADKSIVLACPIGDESFSVISKGRYFQGEKTSGCWEYHKIPLDSPLMYVTPKDVAQIIAWAVL
ncbi:hypothetical protein IMSAGC011_02087 [Lachnospiraceae bacterium]|nr:hypothetical protein IMSAGC011_02087 [Lachnospiraceae bacterium]